MSGQEDCPVCSLLLPSGTTNQEANEAHIAACFESHFSNNMSLERPPPSESAEDDECPVCRLSFVSNGDDMSETEREAHISKCLERSISAPVSSARAPSAYLEKSDISQISSATRYPEQQRSLTKGKSASVLATGDQKAASNSKTASQSIVRSQSGGLKGLFSKLSRESQSQEEKAQANAEKADERMVGRWGPPGSPVHELVMRYWTATRMRPHWEYLRTEHPRQFKKHLNSGYMEPIPTKWVQNRKLAYPNPDYYTFETPAEERLYYLLNNGVMPDGSTHETIKPLNVNWNMSAIIARGNARNARQIPLNPQILSSYRSPGDVFQSDREIKSHNYSEQVQNVVYQARVEALHQLAEGIIHGTDHLETMLLIDVSSSMTWNPHGGMVGPDGIRRYHDQPANIRLVEHLVHRVLHHMIPRAQREHPQQVGIDTVTFSNYGNYVGQLSTTQFANDWRSRVRLGGGTQVMQGWQVVKKTYFQHQHSMYGHGRFDPTYGWQPTPGMPKLSLLVFLDGEAVDMDEFELELLGETWAYVTIALVGMENCPHHHSHAIELERVAKFNPHVGFFDVHGRVCERLVVEDLLGSVYPVDPPKYEEILRPEYDLPQEELPGYSI